MALRRTSGVSEPDLFTGGAGGLRDDAEPTYSVSQINQLVRDALHRMFPQQLWVKGEIQGYDRNNHRDHPSFVLAEKVPNSDKTFAVSAIMFRERRRMIEAVLARAENRFELRDGIEVRFQVSVDLWDQAGRYQLCIENIDPTYTLGRLAQNRRQILEALAQRRLLDRNKQVPIPLVPLRVGIIASEGSAGLLDFQTHLRQSGFAFAVRVAHAAMQGQKVEADVTAALGRFNQAGDVDVIVITRGGGSSTDMSWFDRLGLAEAVATSRLPVLTGLGHTHDTSVLDIVACASLKTPTDAARFLVDRIRAFLDGLDEAARRLADHAQALLEFERGFVEESAQAVSRIVATAVSETNRWVAVCRRDVVRRCGGLVAAAHDGLGAFTARLTPERLERRLRRDAERIHEQAVRLQDRTIHLIHLASRAIAERSRTCTYPRVSRGLAGQRDWLGHAAGRLNRDSQHRISTEATRVQAWGERIAALDPVRTLRRGFAIARDRDGRLITSAARLHPGDELMTQFHDGTVQSDVRSVQAEGPTSG
ncbi:MAG: exodeoxyribonuclease VII large subunit [Candidatus Omnitrophica bacterium]|nr:exodeoxyribonuclease VII large subunit [Candidatus Omnitrophota bacterium]